MLPLAGKALGVILAIFGSAYLLPFACSAVTPDGDPCPDNRQEMPHFAQQYIPDNLGNEADRQDSPPSNRTGPFVFPVRPFPALQEKPSGPLNPLPYSPPCGRIGFATATPYFCP